jgi:hypothetical protein
MATTGFQLTTGGATLADEHVTDLTKGYYRRIYSGFIEGRKINAVSIGAEAWFWRIHAAADDFGNLTADPTLLHRATTGLRELRASQVVSLVNELVNVGLVREYTVGPEKYLHVVGWTDRQPTPNGKRVRRCPPPSSEVMESWIHLDSSGCPSTGNGSGSGNGGGSGSERGRAKETYPGFDRFWDARPKHHKWTARAKALDKWKAHGLEVRADDVIRSLEAWKVCHDWTKEGGRFMCGVEPWLNQEKYEAAPPPADGREDFFQRPKTFTEKRRDDVAAAIAAELARIPRKESA